MYQTYHNREIVKKFSQIRKEKIPGVHLAANKIETHRKPMTVAIQSESEVVRMSVLPKSKERRSLLSALETIQLILSFGMFTIALIKLIVELLKNDKK